MEALIGPRGKKKKRNFIIQQNHFLSHTHFFFLYSARFKNRENILITNIPLCIKEFQTQWDSLWEEF
jgi:hypothetical protein